MRPFTSAVWGLLVCRVAVVGIAFALALICLEGETTVLSSILTQAAIGMIFVMRGPLAFSRTRYSWARPVAQWLTLASMENALRFATTLRAAELNALAVSLMLINIIYWQWGSYWPFWVLTPAAIGTALVISACRVLRAARPDA